MSLLGNLIWLVFGGLASGLGYITGGLALCATIIGIPWGWQSIKLGLATLVPFGHEFPDARDSGGVLELIANLIWLVLFGWIIALHHLFWALVLAITVIGLPFAAQHLKLVRLALFPFGKEIR